PPTRGARGLTRADTCRPLRPLRSNTDPSLSQQTRCCDASHENDLQAGFPLGRRVVAQRSKRSRSRKKGGAEDPAEKEQKQTRQRMLDRWNKMRALLRVADKEQEVDRLKDPIFSYAEPTRETGGVGTIWVWGTRGRPVALLAQSKANGRPVWGFELVALTEGVSV